MGTGNQRRYGGNEQEGIGRVMDGPKQEGVQKMEREKALQDGLSTWHGNDDWPIDSLRPANAC